MKTLWILDENHKHIASIIAGSTEDAWAYANEHYPNGNLDSPCIVDVIGPFCANARFSYNPNAEVIDWL